LASLPSHGGYSNGVFDNKVITLARTFSNWAQVILKGHRERLAFSSNKKGNAMVDLLFEGVTYGNGNIQWPLSLAQLK